MWKTIKKNNITNRIRCSRAPCHPLGHHQSRGFGFWSHFFWKVGWEKSLDHVYHWHFWIYSLQQPCMPKGWIRQNTAMVPGPCLRSLGTWAKMIPRCTTDIPPGSPVAVEDELEAIKKKWPAEMNWDEFPGQTCQKWLWIFVDGIIEDPGAQKSAILVTFSA